MKPKNIMSSYCSKLISSIFSIIHKIESGAPLNDFELLDNSNHDELISAVNKLIEIIKLEKEQTAFNEQRYKIISGLSDNVIFELDLIENTLCQSNNWNLKISATQFYNGILEKEIVHPSDVYKFIRFFKNLSTGEKSAVEELRLKYSLDSKYIWNEIQGIAIFSDSGEPIKIIGKRTNIDKEKKEKELLEKKAQHDPLTGLYNKETTNVIVDSILSSSPKSNHALFMYDIDNFKAVNDNLGHLLGDAVLKDISSKISALFRSTDVVGRIGGDEFLVFIHDIPDVDLVHKKADEMISIFRRSFMGNQMDYKISGSIGICLYPHDGKTYTELVKCADNALYSAKNHGKDCYQIFNASLTGTYYFNEMQSTSYSCNNNIPSRILNDNISEYIFQILYETQDINSAIHMILELVGNHYNVSRAYVFENIADDICCNNTFEWCNKDIERELEKKHYDIYFKDPQAYFNYFNEDNVFYCENIKSLPHDIYKKLNTQGVHSILQCAIMDGNKFEGYVGFDECNENRFWTKNEISTLSFISKILSTFLIKLRTSIKLEKSYKASKIILDAHNISSYIISASEYKLLFINKMLWSLFPNIKEGDLCYKALSGKDSPCEDCPVVYLNKNCFEHTSEIYNIVIKKNVSTTATQIKWVDGCNACMISCTIL